MSGKAAATDCFRFVGKRCRTMRWREASVRFARFPKIARASAKEVSRQAAVPESHASLQPRPLEPAPTSDGWWFLNPSHTHHTGVVYDAKWNKIKNKKLTTQTTKCINSPHRNPCLMTHLQRCILEHQKKPRHEGVGGAVCAQRGQSCAWWEGRVGWGLTGGPTETSAPSHPAPPTYKQMEHQLKQLCPTC